jgi:Fe-S cluster assembly scaffold protein SufB
MILYKTWEKANCIFVYFFYNSAMNTIQINDANIRINESCYLYDTGTVERVEIDIAEWIQVEYCFVAMKDEPQEKYHRHVKINKNSKFTGTSVIIWKVDIEIVTEIVWDDTTSILDILALATDSAHISVEGIVRVASPYRHVSTRVDQTNILIGAGARVRGVPRLEIATDDIEGGHSCRIHRLGGEAVFYLTSRGLTPEHAEALLLNSEILRHLRTIEESTREWICYDIHMKLKK